MGGLWTVYTGHLREVIPSYPWTVFGSLESWWEAAVFQLGPHFLETMFPSISSEGLPSTGLRRTPYRHKHVPRILGILWGAGTKAIQRDGS